LQLCSLGYLLPKLYIILTLSKKYYYRIQLEVIALKFEIEEVLSNNDIDTEFNQIYSIKTGALIGYEVISRGPANSIFYLPAIFLSHAKKVGMLLQFQINCYTNALECLKSFGEYGKLILNIDAETIADERFMQKFNEDIIEKYSVNPETIIFKITKDTPIDNFGYFITLIKRLKEKGFSIAIDDIGAGYSTLSTISEICPQYLKMDAVFTNEIENDKTKQSIMKHFVDFSNEFDANIIMCGIEKNEQFETLADLGVHYGEITLPIRSFEESFEVARKMKDIIINANISAMEKRRKNIKLLIGDIAQKNTVISSDTLCSELETIFKENQSIEEIIVIDSINKVKGLITLSQYLLHIANQYGWAVYANKPVSKIMDCQPLIVDFNTPINDVIKIITKRDKSKFYDAIIVTTNNEYYYGVVPIISLLQNKILEDQMAC
jgi:EAL domain-containing protein (putative c-di-GMP-specific phosphodiesterase class I)/CBS domain-containing protein